MRIRGFYLATAACAIAPGVHALEISSNGVGDAVLLPYYSTHAGSSTLFSVTNHTDAAKAVRVAIAEGYGGRVGLTFNVYLAPRDSWSGALSATSSTESTPPTLMTRDASCTTGTFGADGKVLLRSDAYTGSSDDKLGDDPIRLHQGQIEIVELGTLTGSAAQQAASGECDALRSRFLTGGVWEANPNVDVGTPSGGLSGEAHVVNVQEGIGFDIAPIVFAGFSGAARHTNDFRVVRIFKPVLAAGQNEFAVGNARFAADHGADAVSYTLMAARIEGGFMLNESMDAQTVWAMSFPTRAAYVDNRPGGELGVGAPLRAPFAGDSIVRSDTQTCLTASARSIDRTGKLGDATPVPFCGQVFDLPFYWAGDEGVGSPLFDPSPVSVFTGDVEQGSVRIEFDPSLGMSYQPAGGSASATIKGLPVVAYSLMQARNAAAQPGLLATYAITGSVVRTQ